MASAYHKFKGSLVGIIREILVLDYVIRDAEKFSLAMPKERHDPYSYYTETF